MNGDGEYKEIELPRMVHFDSDYDSLHYIQYDADTNMLIYDPDDYDVSVRSCTPIPFSYSFPYRSACTNSPELGPVASAPPVDIEHIDLLSDSLMYTHSNKKQRRGSYDFDEDPSQLSETESVYEEKDVQVDTRYIQTPVTTDKIYKRPPKSSTSARTIWKQSGLGSQASLYDIERHLMDWVHKYTSVILNTEDHSITRVTWKCDKTKTTYSTTWTVFVRWVLCASMQVPPP